MTRDEAIVILEAIYFLDEEKQEALHMAIEALSIEIVRCKDCKDAKYTEYAPPECRWYCKNSTNYHDGSFFCSLGERKEDARNGNH